MVIPSFYTRDDDRPSACTQPAGRQPPVDGPQSSAAVELFQRSLPDQILNNHANLTCNEGKRDTDIDRTGERPLLRERRGEAVQGALKPEEQASAGWRESEIMINLFLGDLQDAMRFDGMIISVLADVMPAEPQRTIHLPFLANGRATLDSTAALIDSGLRLGMRVLVHCEEGCERAPLAIAWFLRTRRGMSLDEAYKLIKSRRPIVRDRRAWLGIYNC
jgi:dual specificity protein phosphatase-like protein